MADQSYGLPSVAEVAIQEDKEILAGYSPPPRIEGVTVVSGAGVLASGTILGRVTASGKYDQFLDTNVDGTEVPTGVLRSMVDATSEDRPGEMIVSGLLKSDQIVEPANGTIAEAITAGGAFTGAYNDTVRNVLRLG